MLNNELRTKLSVTKFSSLILLLCFPFITQADELNGANTAWILTSTALVLFMTLPGLALFYGGLVGKKNILSILMQCFAIAGIASIFWLVIGYSLAFDEGNSLLGGFSKMFLMALQKMHYLEISLNLYLLFFK